MKMYFKYGYSAFSGMLDQLVCQAWYHGNLCLGRKFTYPNLTENNTHIGLVGKNLTTVYQNVSPTYLQDLKTYCLRNKRENMPRNVDLYRPMPGSLAVFVQMMSHWYDSDPEHVDLTTVTIPDIIALDADVQTISSAVTAGFLRHIRVSDDLTAGIQ
jgi:hypothetical protein